MQSDEFGPVTPGEILKEEFLAEYDLSQGALARAIGISPNRIIEIINNRAVSPQTRRCGSHCILETARNSG
jgi:addiction module HigA family antidote